MTDSTRLACDIRRLSLMMVHRARAAHIGSALSIADIIAVLYSSVLKVDASVPKWADRDRFILSKGHSCVALYAALAKMSFFDPALLQTYGQTGSILMNHVSHHVPGVEFSTGSLGHGLPFAVGKALAAQRAALSWRTFVLLSDGELDEGSNWEAFLFAGHHKLASLTAVVDYNKLQSLGSVANTLNIEPLRDKLASFGWQVTELDGHSHDQLRAAFSRAGNQPHIIIAHTTKGKGISFMEGLVEWHYRSPNESQLAQAMAELEAVS